MQMDRVRDDTRAGFQEARRLRIEEVGVAPHLVDGPVRRLLVEDERQRILRLIFVGSITCVRQIMWWKTKRSADGGAIETAVSLDVVDSLISSAAT